MMRVGLLVTSIGDFGQKGFYNAQEIGLARELERFVSQIVIYRLVAADQSSAEEEVKGCKNTTYKLIPSKSYGSNGLIDVGILDGSMDAIIFFSDTQVCVPRVYKWAKKNDVKLFPYIGVASSHGSRRLKKMVMDFLFRRDLAVYRKCRCFAKTPAVKCELEAKGVSDITVAPVGLDISLLHQTYAEADRVELKLKYGFEVDDKVILFISRMTEKKQPLKMVDIFLQLHGGDDRYRLLMVGTGPLEGAVEKGIGEAGLSAAVKRIDRIPNSDIWELYCLAECFVNLNQQEIFGMAILEAMYYGCKVVAWRAPGPELIIENGVDGVICDSDEDVIRGVRDASIDTDLSHEKILREYSWTMTAKKMYEEILG